MTLIFETTSSCLWLLCAFRILFISIVKSVSKFTHNGVKSFETFINIRYLDRIPLEGTISSRIAFYKEKKEAKGRDIFVWLGLSASFASVDPFVSGIYLDPSFVLKGGDMQYKFGFTMAIYQAEFLRKHFGNVPEFNANFAFGHDTD